MIARTWPVDGVVGENGGFAFRLGHRETPMERIFWQGDSERLAARKQREILAESILGAVPGAALASDQPYRELDLAIDYCEDVAPLSPASVDDIVSHFVEAGANVKVSSIHVNGWFGDWNKREMVFRIAKTWWDLDLGGPDAAVVVFIGDSPNDEPMFEALPISIAVAGFAQWAKRVTHLPKYITQADQGAGFIELARSLLRAKPQ